MKHREPGFDSDFEVVTGNDRAHGDPLPSGQP
jgi:hypothetical protein